MSTEIAKISGRVEIISNPVTFEVEYKECELHVTRFYGGSKEGMMIQLTLDPGNYIQLTRKQTKELYKILKKAFS